jgi:hypothetical protein
MTADTRAIDYWTNIFTPEGLRYMYLENDELKKLVSWGNMDDRLRGYTTRRICCTRPGKGSR